MKINALRRALTCTLKKINKHTHTHKHIHALPTFLICTSVPMYQFSNTYVEYGYKSCVYHVRGKTNKNKIRKKSKNKQTKVPFIPLSLLPQATSSSTALATTSAFVYTCIQHSCTHTCTHTLLSPTHTHTWTRTHTHKVYTSTSGHT